MFTWSTPPLPLDSLAKNYDGNSSISPNQSIMNTSSSVQVGEEIQLNPIHAIAPLNISATIARYELAVG